MADAITIQFADGEVLAQHFTGLVALGLRAGGGVMREVVRSGGLERMGTLAVRSVQRGVRQQKSPSGKAYPQTTRFGKPARRLLDSGRLVNAETYEVEGGKLFVGNSLEYAATQHYGEQDRKPKNAKAFAIPLTRQVARAVAGRSFRDVFPDAFSFESKRGNVLLAQKR